MPKKLSTHHTILITQPNPTTQNIINQLQQWTQQGLLHPFTHHQTNGQTNHHTQTENTEHKHPYQPLANQQLHTIRIAALATTDTTNHQTLHHTTQQLTKKIRDDLAPQGTTTHQIHIWAPHDPREQNTWNPPQNYFTQHANANIIITPEDRQTETQTAIPITHPNTEHSDYTTHTAAETATTLGLWAHMQQAPTDTLTPGTHEYNQPKIHLTRSFIKIAELPTPNTQNPTNKLPKPPNTHPTPYPQETIKQTLQHTQTILETELNKTTPPTKTPHTNQTPQQLLTQHRHQLATQGGIPINQNIWKQIRTHTFSLADGTPTTNQPPNTPTTIIQKPNLLAPNPNPNPEHNLRTDTHKTQPKTLLGAIGKQIQQLHHQAQQQIQQHTQTYQKLTTPTTLKGITTPTALTTALTTLTAYTAAHTLNITQHLPPNTPTWTWITATLLHTLTVGIITHKTIPHLKQNKKPKTKPIPWTPTLITTAVATAITLLTLQPTPTQTATTITTLTTLTALTLTLLLNQPHQRTKTTRKHTHTLLNLTALYHLTLAITNLPPPPNPQTWLTITTALTATTILTATTLKQTKTRKTRNQLTHLQHQLKTAANTHWATEEAYEQYCPTAAAWAHIIHNPHGPQPPPPDTPKPTTGFTALKTQTQTYTTTPLGQTALTERLHQTNTQQGWLTQQYQNITETYQKTQATKHGTTPQNIPPPDEDPQETRNTPPDQRTQTLNRHKFLHNLTQGKYNQTPPHQTHKNHLTATKWVWQQPGTLQPQNLNQYLHSIAPQKPQQASYVYFHKNARKTVNRTYHPTLWWPTDINTPPDHQPIHHTPTLHHNNKHTAAAIRHDLAGPYTPQQLLPNQHQNPT